MMQNKILYQTKMIEGVGALCANQYLTTAIIAIRAGSPKYALEHLAKVQEFTHAQMEIQHSTQKMCPQCLNWSPTDTQEYLRLEEAAEEKRDDAITQIHHYIRHPEGPQENPGIVEEAEKMVTEAVSPTRAHKSPN